MPQESFLSKRHTNKLLFHLPLRLLFLFLCLPSLPHPPLRPSVRLRKGGRMEGRKGEHNAYLRCGAISSYKKEQENRSDHTNPKTREVKKTLVTRLTIASYLDDYTSLRSPDRGGRLSLSIQTARLRNKFVTALLLAFIFC